MELCTGGSLFNLLDDPENSYGLDEVTQLCKNQYLSVQWLFKDHMYYFEENSYWLDEVTQLCKNPNNTFQYSSTLCLLLFLLKYHFLG